MKFAEVGVKCVEAVGVGFESVEREGDGMRVSIDGEDVGLREALKYGEGISAETESSV